MFKEDTQEVLTRGLKQMSIACEAITKQNEILNNDIQNLKNKLTQAKEKLLVNNIEV
jgi:hypothetical protein